MGYMNPSPTLPASLPSCFNLPVMPKALLPSVIDHVLQKLSEGKSTAQIHAGTKVSFGSISKIRSEHCPELPKCPGGRPPKLSPANIRHATHLLAGPHPTTPSRVAQELSNTNNTPVSSCTVCRQVRKAGLVPFTKPKKPAMSKAHMDACLAFAKAHQDWTVADWKCVLWSDETKVNRLGSDGQRWGYKRAGQTLQPHHTIPTSKHGGGSIMVWACMGWDGPGYMCKIDGTLNKELYIEILEDEFQQTLEYYGKEVGDIIFQQDNAPPHVAQVVQDWFEDHDLEVMEWPANSPDLSPIENLWTQVKRKLYQYPTPAAGMLELWERVQEVWEGVTVEQCQNLIESMPRRIQACIKAKGGPTKY
jgi:transposase